MSRANHGPTATPVVVAALTLVGALWIAAMPDPAHANRNRFDPHPYGQHSKSQHRAYRYDQQYYGFREPPPSIPRLIRPQMAPPALRPVDPPSRPK
ncbi:MAG: hypothetical protein NW217_10985 [Hyphomicrobiaceae bacterium]|nr:hypothetical protein [Hyphomicrobiaceae bacterium]